MDNGRLIMDNLLPRNVSRRGRFVFWLQVRRPKHMAKNISREDGKMDN